MIRETTVSKRIVNLDGPDGNAYVLIGFASRLCRELGRRYFDEEKILKEMKSEDYIHLIKTFDKYFGEYVILETTDKKLLLI